MKQYAPLETAKDIAFDNFFWQFKKAFPQVSCAIAGSILRKKNPVHDIDLVVGSLHPDVIEWCRKKIQSHDTNGSKNLKGDLLGLHTDIWFTTPEEWAPMLLFATGPREFNIFLRKRAKDQRMILNHKGLFQRNSKNEQGNRIDNNTEGNIIWLTLHRRWIPPEERLDFRFPPAKVKDCGYCKIAFKKGEPIIRSEQGEWIHESHIMFELASKISSHTAKTNAGNRHV